jgi:hypothetical protein
VGCFAGSCCCYQMVLLAVKRPSLWWQPLGQQSTALGSLLLVTGLHAAAAGAWQEHGGGATRARRCGPAVALRTPLAEAGAPQSCSQMLMAGGLRVVTVRRGDGAAGWLRLSSVVAGWCWVVAGSDGRWGCRVVRLRSATAVVRSSGAAAASAGCCVCCCCCCGVLWLRLCEMAVCLLRWIAIAWSCSVLLHNTQPAVAAAAAPGSATAKRRSGGVGGWRRRRRVRQEACPGRGLGCGRAAAWRGHRASSVEGALDVPTM